MAVPRLKATALEVPAAASAGNKKANATKILALWVGEGGVELLAQWATVGAGNQQLDGGETRDPASQIEGGKRGPKLKRKRPG